MSVSMSTSLLRTSSESSTRYTLFTARLSSFG
jgi:hypothetical protein